MGLLDVDGFGDFSESEPIVVKDTTVFKENAFEGVVVDKINPLVKYDVINKNYNMRKLLNDLGIKTEGSNMYCPFHPDEMTGKPSAKYHEDTDLVFCFSENKAYSAFHAIKVLYNINTDKVFEDIWGRMGQEDKKVLLDKYDSEDNTGNQYVNTEWDKYKNDVLSMFKAGRVTFKQYKNALYKVFLLLNKETVK